MREDFNKLLVERERIGSSEKFHEVRHKKVFNPEMGGRESMKARHVCNWRGKQFNENLNPLKGWLHSRLGKNWDKSYSELRKTFDTRSVINQHIMEHLWQYVERHAFVNAKGKIVVIAKYTKDGESPISESLSEYYICPKSGILKKTGRKSYKERNRIIEKKKADAKAAIFQKIDDYTELHCIDGIWFKYILKDVPAPIIKYVKPASWTALPEVIRWDKLSDSEKETLGEKTTIQVEVNQLVSPGNKHLPCYARNQVQTKYYAARYSLSGKELKQYGIKNADR